MCNIAPYFSDQGLHTKLKTKEKKKIKSEKTVKTKKKKNKCKSSKLLECRSGQPCIQTVHIICMPVSYPRSPSHANDLCTALQTKENQ